MDDAQWIIRLQGMLTRVQGQRDELLAACQALLACPDVHDSDFEEPETIDAVRMAHAAIAKVLE
jgi:hypothetical protein